MTPSSRGSETPLPRGGDSGLTRRLASGSAWGLGVRIGRVAVAVVGVAALARLLTPADFGIFALITIAVTLAYSISEGLVDYAVLRHDHLTVTHLRSLTWLTMWCLLALLTIVLVMAFVLDPYIGSARSLGPSLLITAPAVLAQPFLVGASALLRREHRFRAAFLLGLIAPVAFNSGAIALALAGYTLSALLTAQSFAMVLNALVLVAVAQYPLSPLVRLDFGGTLRTSLAGSSSRLLAWATTNLDTVTVAILFGASGTGFYSRAYTMNVQLKEPFTIVEAMSRQAMTSLRMSGRLTGERAGRVFRVLTLTGALVGGTVAVASEPLVRILLGPQWDNSAVLLSILAWGLPARIGINFLDGLAVAGGRVRTMLLRSSVFFAVTLVGLLALGHLGLNWVAVAVTAGVYLTLFFPIRDGGPVWIRTPDRIRLFLPALLTLAALEGVEEGIASFLPTGVVPELLGTAGALITVSTLALAIAPTSWMPAIGGRTAGPRGIRRLSWALNGLRRQRPGPAFASSTDEDHDSVS